MKNRVQSLLAILTLLSILTAQLSTAFAQGTAFTYQGQLQNNGSPASGTYNLQFSLYTNNTGGAAAAGPVTNSAVGVTNGLFTVAIDFGSSPWNGETNWLQIGVETNGSNSFTTLAPRQQLTPIPYAISAESLNGTVGSAGLSGTYGNQVNMNNSANQFNGSYAGNGGGLTNVNAAAIGGLAATNFWLTTGNTGTSPTNGNFLGTVDNQPFEIRVGGLRGWRVEPDGRGDGAANLIGGYISNAVQQPFSGANVIAGGGYSAGLNIISSNSGGNFIGAGSANLIGPYVNNDFIGGGGLNTIQSGNSAIVAGTSGTIASNAPSATIGGGNGNVIGEYSAGGGGSYSTIGGGVGNTIDEEDSFIGGGQGNFIQVFADHSVIGGGGSNQIAGAIAPSFGVIAGGYLNTIQTNSSYDFIGGGYGNIVSNTVATVGGGTANTASGNYSTVPGGVNNGAYADRSFAAGDGALATNSGSFVWADASGGFFPSTVSNQFNVRAMGGVRLVTGGAGMTLDGQGVGPLGNYVFAYSTVPQFVSPSIFQNVTFTTTAQINGWVAAGSSQFICNQAGLYLIHYTAEAHFTDSMSMRGTLNSAEILGSQAYSSSSGLAMTTVISQNFIVSASVGNILAIQYTGNNGSDELEGGGTGVVMPSISLTITRIQ
jgi:hypothetical protein